MSGRDRDDLDHVTLITPSWVHESLQHQTESEGLLALTDIAHQAVSGDDVADHSYLTSVFIEADGPTTENHTNRQTGDRVHSSHVEGIINTYSYQTKGGQQTCQEEVEERKPPEEPSG